MKKDPEIMDKMFIFMLLIKEILKDLLKSDEFKGLLKEILDEEGNNAQENLEIRIGEPKFLNYFS